MALMMIVLYNLLIVKTRSKVIKTHICFFQLFYVFLLISDSLTEFSKINRVVVYILRLISYVFLLVAILLFFIRGSHNENNKNRK